MQFNGSIAKAAIIIASLAVVAGCSDGGSSTTPPPPAPPSPPPPPPPPPTSSSVTVSGIVTYEFVPPNASNVGLDYDATQILPSRGVVVQALDASNQVIASDVTDENGAYEVSVPSNTNVRIQARAELLESTAGTWDIDVVDNTNSNAIYVLQGSLTSSGAANSTRNLFAPSGWGGTSYTAPRTAAPFAILDAIYDAVIAINTVEPGTVFPDLQIFWSPLNRAADGNVADGEIGTSSFTFIGGIPTILILGDENSDTDEYDRSVVIHEFGHYTENALGRSDSIGGSHSLDDLLDPRVAWSEGYSNAFASIIDNDPIYRDSGGNQQQGGFFFSVEANSRVFATEGWFSEFSVQSIVYDIFDSNSDGADTISAGFAPIYQSLTGDAFTTNPNPTTIFSFINALRTVPGIDVGAIDVLLNDQNINGTGADGAGETNSGGVSNALPVFPVESVGGAALEICSIDDEGTFNALGNRRLVRVSIPTTQNYTISMTRTSGPSGRDPDFQIFRLGDFINQGISAVPDSETLSANLPAGEYFFDAYDFLNINADGPSGDVCFDFSVQ
ncbi:MAG: hypothetical protein AAGD92_06475 [Pseudomonadota bacterium]